MRIRPGLLPFRPTLRRLGAVALVAAVAAVLAVGLVMARDEPSGVAAPAVRGDTGDPAPRIEGTDPVTGKRVTLADFEGRPVVINVWASWCPGCVAEAADLARFAEDYPEAQVIGINYQDSKEGARAFYAEHRWRHPSIFDPAGDIAAALGLQGMPSTFFLDARHRVVTRIVGETDYAGFEEGLRLANSG